MMLSVLWTLLFYILLGAMLAWPCWLLLRHMRHIRQPPRCVQRYQPHLANQPLPNAEAADAAQSTLKQ